MDKTLHARIKSYRRSHKLSQGHMANLLNMSQPSYSMLENGKRDITPTIMEDLIENAIIPSDAIDLPDRIKEQVEAMNVNDQEMLFQIAQRMVR